MTRARVALIIAASVTALAGCGRFGFDARGDGGNGGSNGDGGSADAFPTDGSNGATGARVLAGGLTSCALRVDHTVWCWGDNSSGQLGMFGPPSVTPLQIPVLDDAIAITLGSDFGLAIRGDGSVWGWGDNGDGQLGDPDLVDHATPIAVQGLPNAAVVEVHAGVEHACARYANGDLWCWGNDYEGELGDGNDTMTGVPPTRALQNVVTATAAGEHTCAVTADHAVWCWGENYDAELGTGDENLRLVPTQIAVGSAAASVFTGISSTCALLVDGHYSCWGENDHGQVGVGDFQDHATPQPESALGELVEISVGDHHACGRQSDGTVSCWGGDEVGELGNGGTSDMALPQPVAWSDAAVAISAAQRHTCATRTDGTFACWGSSSNGQLANGLIGRFAPTGLDTTASAIAAGSDHTCAIVNGVPTCWGAGDAGQIGDGTLTDHASPTPVALTAQTGIAVGDEFSCSYANAGAGYCWGRNAEGELGNGTMTPTTTPVTLLGMPAQGATSLAAGGRHTCTISNGTVLCWGAGDSGELGDGAQTNELELGGVSGSNAGSGVVAGGHHSCSINAAGSLLCWGSSSNGQLGNGTTTDSDTPGAVIQTGWTAAVVVAGETHTCAIDSVGNLRCWGSNGSGELGLGNYSDVSTPTLVSLGSTTPKATAVGAGNGTTCAVFGGDLYCWGQNSYGQLGTGDSAWHSEPAKVMTGVAVQTLAIGGAHACFLTTTGALSCWGDNSYGELGLGTLSRSTTPLTISVP